MNHYDTFVAGLQNLSDGQEMVLNIRDLTPGRKKYKYIKVRAQVSSQPEKYPDRLWLRFQRGQLLDQPWSINILEVLDSVPAEFQ